MSAAISPPAPTLNTPRWEKRDKVSLAGMIGFVLLLNVIGWGVLVLVVAPQHYTLGSAGVFGVGLGLTAYLLGVRHAFDADHIAVIDNTTRKLVGEGNPALGAGFWIVGLFVATWLIALAVWRFGRIEERWDSPGT